MKKLIEKFASRFTLHASLILLALSPMPYALCQQGIIQLPATGQTTSYYPGDDGDLQTGVPIPSDRFTDNGNGSITDAFTGLMWVKDGNLIASRDPSFDQDRTPGDGDVDWTHALDYVQLLNNQNYLGYNDWRLPAVNELVSLIDHSQQHTGLPANHPFMNLKEGYWSSTTSDQFKYEGFPIFLKEYRVHANTNFPPGYMEGLIKNLDIYSPSYYKLYVLPVRDDENNGTIDLPRSGQDISYYPGDDGDLAPGTPWPSPRLIDNRDQTVVDRLTGLMWTQDANVMLSRDPNFAGEWGRVEWTDALDYVAKLNNENYLGHNDWRLPNRLEMKSLFDFSRSDLMLPEGHPFIHADVLNDSSAVLNIWTSTTLARNADSAWSVSLITATLRAISKSVESYVWPVRTDNTTLPQGSIQGMIDGEGISGEGVWINITGPVNAFTKTDANGNYEFSFLPNGTYTVEPAYWYYTFTPLSRVVTVSGSPVTANFTAAFNRAYGWTDISQGLYPLEHGTGSNLVSVFFINDEEGWITGSECIFHTTDGGMTFEEQTTLDYCTSIYMFDENEGWAGGNGGFIYHTTDGGDTWQLTNFMGPSCLDISFAPGSYTGFCSGSNGQLWKIGPGMFEQVYTGLAGDMTSVEALSPTECFFCGSATNMYYYDGSTVTAQVTGTTTPYSIDLFNDQLGWVVGSSGEIDGFAGLDHSWPELHPWSDTENYYDIDSPDGPNVWAVGAYGSILHSPNGNDFYFTGPYNHVNNTFWNFQSQGMTSDALWKIQFTSPINGYAVGENGTILKYNMLEGAPEGADILGFAVSDQVGSSVIDQENLTVYAEVGQEADLTAIIPELFLSADATCNPPSGQMQDFTDPVVYTVTNSDGSLVQVWTVSVDFYTRIEEQEGMGAWEQGSVVVWPNPTRGEFKVQSSKFKVEFESLEFVDLYGKSLNCSPLHRMGEGPGVGAETLELDISHLPAGIYFIRIHLENQMIVKKIIKL